MLYLGHCAVRIVGSGAKMDDGTVSRSKVVGFWTWLVRADSQGNRGIDNLANRWLAFHILVALAAAFLVTTDSATISKAIIIPTAGILIGLAFGWAGRSAGLLHDKEFSAFVLSYGAPPEGYVYSFQLAILTMLGFIALALVLAMGGTDLSFGDVDHDAMANRFLLGFVGSIAVREGWGTIYFVNKLTIQFYHFRALQLAAQEPNSVPD